jgi:hypothetical protein
VWIGAPTGSQQATNEEETADVAISARNNAMPGLTGHQSPGLWLIFPMPSKESNQPFGGNGGPTNSWW